MNHNIFIHVVALPSFQLADEFVGQECKQPWCTSSQQVSKMITVLKSLGMQINVYNANRYSPWADTHDIVDPLDVPATHGYWAEMEKNVVPSILENMRSFYDSAVASDAIGETNTNAVRMRHVFAAIFPQQVAIAHEVNRRGDQNCKFTSIVELCVFYRHIAYEQLDGILHQCSHLVFPSHHARAALTHARSQFNPDKGEISETPVSKKLDLVINPFVYATDYPDASMLQTLEQKRNTALRTLGCDGYFVFMGKRNNANGVVIALCAVHRMRLKYNRNVKLVLLGKDARVQQSDGSIPTAIDYLQKYIGVMGGDWIHVVEGCNDQTKREILLGAIGLVRPHMTNDVGGYAVIDAILHGVPVATHPYGRSGELCGEIIVEKSGRSRREDSDGEQFTVYCPNDEVVPSLEPWADTLEWIYTEEKIHHQARALKSVFERKFDIELQGKKLKKFIEMIVECDEQRNEKDITIVDETIAYVNAVNNDISV